MGFQQSLWPEQNSSAPLSKGNDTASIADQIARNADRQAAERAHTGDDQLPPSSAWHDLGGHISPPSPHTTDEMHQRLELGMTG